MLITDGTRVRHKITGDTGKVMKIINQNMVSVLTDDGQMEIPMYLEDLEKIDSNSTIKGKIVKGKEKPTIKTREEPTSKPQYTILKSLGIQVGFETTASETSYHVHIFNDTQYDVVFECSLKKGDKTFLEHSGKLESMSMSNIGEMRRDALSDQPLLFLECKEISTEGLSQAFTETIKIKPQQFFKKIRTAPFLDKEIYLYRMITSFQEKMSVLKSEENLKDYTQRKIEEQEEAKEEVNYVQFDSTNLSEVIEFSNELDLHIEELESDHFKLSNQQKLQIQLAAFDDYLEQAIRIGVDRVFIIHGVGKGRLKNDISQRLHDNPYVLKFVNEYHPSYGWGATEVFL